MQNKYVRKTREEINEEAKFLDELGPRRCGACCR